MALETFPSEDLSIPLNLSKNKNFTLFQNEHSLPKPFLPTHQKAHIPSVYQFVPESHVSLIERHRKISISKQTASRQLFATSGRKQQQVNSLLPATKPCSNKSNAMDLRKAVLDMKAKCKQSTFKIPTGLPVKQTIEPEIVLNEVKKTGNKVNQMPAKIKKPKSYINRVDAHYAKTSRRPKQNAATVTLGSMKRRPPGYDMYLLPEPKNDSLNDLLNSSSNAVKRNFSLWLKGELQFLVPQSTYLQQLQSVPDNILEWTTAHVATFINALGMSEAADYFVKHGVDGLGLLMLKQCDLMDFVGLQPLPAAYLFGFVLRLHGDITHILGMGHSSSIAPNLLQLADSSNNTHPPANISEHFEKLKIGKL